MSLRTPNWSTDTTDLVAFLRAAPTSDLMRAAADTIEDLVRQNEALEREVLTRQERVARSDLRQAA